MRLFSLASGALLLTGVSGVLASHSPFSSAEGLIVGNPDTTTLLSRPDAQASRLTELASALLGHDGSVTAGVTTFSNAVNNWDSEDSSEHLTSLSGTIDSLISQVQNVLTPMGNLVNDGTQLQELTSNERQFVTETFPRFQRGVNSLKSAKKILEQKPQGISQQLKPYVAQGSGIQAVEEDFRKAQGLYWPGSPAKSATPSSPIVSPAPAVSHAPSPAATEGNSTPKQTATRSERPVGAPKSTGKQMSMVQPTTTEQSTYTGQSTPTEKSTSTEQSTSSTQSTPPKQSTSTKQSPSTTQPKSTTESTSTRESTSTEKSTSTTQSTSTQKTTFTTKTTTATPTHTADPAEANKVTGSIAIAWHSFQGVSKEPGHSGWAVRTFQNKDGDFCDGYPNYPNTIKGKNIKLSEVGFPPSFEFKDLGDDKGHECGSSLPKWPCRYERTGDSPGKLHCTGWKTVTCSNDLASANKVKPCKGKEVTDDGEFDVVPKVFCDMPNNQKE